MQHHIGPGQPPIPRDPIFNGHCPQNTDPKCAHRDGRALTGEPPRVFALVQEFGEDDETGEGGEEVVTEVWPTG